MNKTMSRRDLTSASCLTTCLHRNEVNMDRLQSSRPSVVGIEPQNSDIFMILRGVSMVAKSGLNLVSNPMFIVYNNSIHGNMIPKIFLLHMLKK